MKMENTVHYIGGGIIGRNFDWFSSTIFFNPFILNRIEILIKILGYGSEINIRFNSNVEVTKKVL